MKKNYIKGFFVIFIVLMLSIGCKNPAISDLSDESDGLGSPITEDTNIGEENGADDSADNDTENGDSSGDDSGTFTSYTVSFVTNGGSEVAQMETASIAIEPVTTKTGYAFDGWFDNEGLDGNSVTFPYAVIADTTLYAMWTANHLLMYDENAGTGNIGRRGPGGGIIFYASEEGFVITDTGDLCHYLEAAPEDAPSLFTWASYGSYTTHISGTGKTIGSGRKNTALILAKDAAAPAASYCNALTTGSQKDWFLPSIDELEQLYQQRELAGIGTFDTTKHYWSSSQRDGIDSWSDKEYAWELAFDGGYRSGYYKSTQDRVRPIRAF